ncbi:hypothetical protein ACFFSY_29250 [Paenibacillus aurantiacus]|uniref:DUF3606 domain-containing protein n=1 Tax=Paenibacillus aurantiacus TaxID=1936118 RepID=A0ABV5KXX6_9BACL
MAMFQRSEKADQQYRARVRAWDDPPDVDVVKSVTETRKVYANLTDVEFIAWYVKKYPRVSREVVRKVLDRAKGQHDTSQ